MHLYKRETLNHHSVPELVVIAGKIAKSKGFRGLKDVPGLAVSNKHELITYIANGGETPGERHVKTRDIPNWGKKK